VVTAALGVVAVMRLVAWDRYDLFAILNALTLFVYLPAWIIAVVALVGRRWLLAGAALLVVAAQVAFLAPELTAAEPLPAWAAHAPTLTLLDANVYDVNHSLAGYARQIASVRPDLVTLEEATPELVTGLDHSGSMARLPYRFEIKRSDPGAVFIASRYPLTAPHVITAYGRPVITEVTIGLPSGPQALWVVHTIAPLPSSFALWKGLLTTIRYEVQARGPAGLLVVGDFNATWGNQGFRQILATGLTDGAAARGKPFEMTWSQTKPVIPPVVRIDHVLTGPGVTVTGIRTDVGAGSDHRDVIATVAVRPKSST
jgi:endonuclease/exonuclease/phosphatase (EEP) superfamily protein YafD